MKKLLFILLCLLLPVAVFGATLVDGVSLPAAVNGVIHPAAVNGVTLTYTISTSYSNPGGTGDRTALITVTDSYPPYELFGGYSGTSALETLVNGAPYQWTIYFATQDAAGRWFRFDFGAPKVITEAKWYQQTTDAQGTWVWQGSTDNSTWNNIGTSFAFGGATTQVITSLSGNTNYYRYYRLLGVNGSVTSNPWLYQMEFKISD